MGKGVVGPDRSLTEPNGSLTRRERQWAPDNRFQRNEGRAGGCLCRQTWHQGLVAVADHRVYARESGELVRCALRVAPGHDDPRRGIFPLHTAKKGARCTVSLSGDTAGIHYDDGGLSRAIGLA